MGGVLAALVAWLSPGPGLAGVALLAVICGLGGLAYALAAQLSGGLELKELRRMIRRA
jgi:hypothetical protein